jgi:hypothetical protein
MSRTITKNGSDMTITPIKQCKLAEIVKRRSV